MENVKKNLRSVLLSKVGGVALKNVEQDYKNLVGEKLSWRQFGYGSFEAFLNDIPDVVKVAFKKDALYAFGVAENMSYINPTARKAQFKGSQTVPQNGSTTGKMTVYIGNLPLNVTKETLKSYLSRYPVTEINMDKHQNGISAWVITSKEVGQQMCSELNKQRYGDRTLKVEPARNQRAAEKPCVPTQPSRGDSSGHSSAASVNSDGESVSVKKTSTKNLNVVKSVNSVDIFSKSNGVVETLCRGVTVETGQRRRSLSDVENSGPGFVHELAGYNYSNIQTSESSGFKNSAIVSEVMRFNNGADFRKDNSNFPFSSEPPPLVENDDWEEFENRGRPSNIQRGYVMQTRDEPPLLSLRDELEKWQQKNEISSSTSWPRNASIQNEQLYRKPFEETYNLYVKNIPLGTTAAELSQLFENAVKIVPLSRQSCFAVFNTFCEVEDASRKNWAIRGLPIVVDVATRHKISTSEPDGRVQPTRNGSKDQILDSCSGFDNLTCTVGCNNERTVKLHGEKLPVENKSIVSRPQTSSTSKDQENFQQRSSSSAEMPPLGSRADPSNSRVNLQLPPNNNEIPPLLSMEDIMKYRENRKALLLTNLCNSEATQGNFPPATLNDLNSKQLGGSLTSQAALEAPIQETLPSKPVDSFSNFDGDFQTSNQKTVPSKQMHDKLKSRHDIPTAAQTVSSVQYSNSLKNENNLQSSGQEVMPTLRQHDHPKSRGNFQPSSAGNEAARLDSHGYAALLSSQLPMATSCSQGAPSVAPLRPIPDEMRLKELQRMLIDTFPGDTLPTSHMLPDIIDVIIICVVPGFENSYFWGQAASEPFESELQKMYDLIPRMEEISGSMNSASASVRRGAAKYGEDWCRVWIKQRGETASTVFFIDFGNFETISNNDIYELPEEFWRVRPTALPFRVLDAGKVNLLEHINQRVTAKVNKKSQRGCVFEIHDLHAQS